MARVLVEESNLQALADITRVLCGTSITYTLHEMVEALQGLIPTITNQVSISTDSSGNIYNTTGYKDNYRINSSGEESAMSGFAVTGYIPFTKGQTIRLSGDGISFGEYGCMMYFYDDTKTVISGKGVPYNQVGNANVGTWADESNTVITYTPSVNYPTKNTTNGYFRISAKGLGSNMVITLDEPIP